VQSNSAPTTFQSSLTTLSATFSVAQTAGNLNIVVVGWGDTTSLVSTVTDSRGNTNTQAGGTTTGSGLRQAIYYAKNIVAAGAGANVVTVTFSVAASFPDIRILEYKGADPINPVDVTAAATGSTTSSNSGTATTTNPTDLIFGANMVGTYTSGAGAGFTLRLDTSPDGDIAEDQMVAAAEASSPSSKVASIVTSGRRLEYCSWG
jgi:hypothetical protein